MWERKAQGEALVLLRLTTGDLLKPDSGAGREGEREGGRERRRGEEISVIMCSQLLCNIACKDRIGF